MGITPVASRARTSLALPVGFVDTRPVVDVPRRTESETRSRPSRLKVAKAKPPATDRAKPEKAAKEAARKEPERATCKRRPENNRPKRGGGGSRAYVPWCG